MFTINQKVIHYYFVLDHFVFKFKGRYVRFIPTQFVIDKKFLSKLLKLFILAILFTGCSHNLHLLSKLDSTLLLQRELDMIFSDPSIANAQCGVAIKSLTTGEIIYFRSARKAFVPASNLKLFTTAAALLELGPQYQFHTDLYMDGNLDQRGVLNGDLILSGSGDPSISAGFHEGNSITVFENFCDSLKTRGIKEISGRIIGDDNYFDDEPLGAGWAWDYQSDYYAAQISALSFNDNCLNLLITPGDSAGALAGISTIPSTDYVQIKNKLVTVAEGKTKINVHRIPKENQIICSGTITPDQKEVQETVTIENPTLYSSYIFKELLEHRGIAVDGAAVDIDDIDHFDYCRETARKLAQYNSPLFRDIITTTLKESKNLYAELLLRTLGKESTGVGNAAAGIKTTCQILTEMGIDTTQIFMADGSGLSRKDFITPMSVVTLLTFMSRHPFAKIFYDSLPVAGVDGTLAQRMLGTTAAGNVHAKTGTLDFVKALSGYVTSKDGEKFAFSILINNYKVSHSVVNRIQDMACERLANFVR